MRTLSTVSLLFLNNACLFEGGLGSDDGVIFEADGEQRLHNFSFLCSWHLAVVWEPPLFLLEEEVFVFPSSSCGFIITMTLHNIIVKGQNFSAFSQFSFRLLDV